MAHLSAADKRKLENLFGMSSGYVLDFSNRTFEEFVQDITGRDIFDALYEYGSGSKANRLRAFWSAESNHTVGRLLEALIEYHLESTVVTQLHEDCRRIANRLMQESPVADLDAIEPNADERGFELLAKSVREAIESDEPETGLDRLHTFLVRYVRVLAEGQGIRTPRDKALHSLFGEYLKAVRAQGLIESEMTERILKTNISILEAFNHVRNNQSFAHDNPVLNYDEALLIYNNVASAVRFLAALDRKAQAKLRDEVIDELPF